MTDSPNATRPAPRKEREERPKNNIKEDLDYRIKGLEQAKLETGMTDADVAALDRAIAKLREKKAEKVAAKPEKQEELP